MNTRALVLVATVALAALNGPTAAQNHAPDSGSAQAGVVPGWSTDSPTVPSREALRAKAPEERRRAVHYDWPNPTGEPLVGLRVVIACHPEMPPPPPGEEIVRPDYGEFLKTVACRYDAIAVGGAALRRVMLNESESSLFSEYTLSVEEWIRPAAGPRLISVSRAGGRVDVADGTALGSEFNGRGEPAGRRLFMLTRIAGTSGFDIAHSFEIESGRIQPRFAEIDFGYRPQELLTAEPLDAGRFLRDLARAGARCPAMGR